MAESQDTPEERVRKEEHKRMIGVLCRDKAILARALGLDANRLWIRGREYILNPQTGEKADLVFQDRWNASFGDPEATCFVVELKSDQVDHEVLGQLKKAVDIMGRLGATIQHWGKTVGVAIGKRFTMSGLDLLVSSGYICFEWVESGGHVELVPTGPLFADVAKKSDGIVRKARRKGVLNRW